MKEYKVISTECSGSSATDTSTSERILNKYATEGWRLITVSPCVGGQYAGVTEYYLFFLERDKTT